MTTQTKTRSGVSLLGELSIKELIKRVIKEVQTERLRARHIIRMHSPTRK